VNISNTNSPEDWEEGWEAPIFQEEAKPFPGRDPHGEMFWPNYQERRRKRIAQIQLQRIGDIIVPFVRPISFLGLTLWMLKQPLASPPKIVPPMSQIIGFNHAIWQNTESTLSQNPQIQWVQEISPWPIQFSPARNSWDTALGSINLHESQLIETIVLVDHVAKTPSLWTKPNLYLDAQDPGSLYFYTKL